MLSDSVCSRFALPPQSHKARCVPGLDLHSYEIDKTTIELRPPAIDDRYVWKIPAGFSYGDMIKVRAHLNYEKKEERSAWTEKRRRLVARDCPELKEWTISESERPCKRRRLEDVFEPRLPASILKSLKRVRSDAKTTRPALTPTIFKRTFEKHVRLFLAIRTRLF